MIYFTADTHFNHLNIIKMADRPFTDVDEMNEALLDAWNSKINKNDDVYFLGDLSFCGIKKCKSIVERLNGRIIWIVGNHDQYAQRLHKEYPDKIIKVLDYLTIKDPYDRKQPIVLFHYPIQSWVSMHGGSWHLHGHSHGGTNSDGLFRLDVGVDARNDDLYQPYSIQEIREHFQQIKEKTK